MKIFSANKYFCKKCGVAINDHFLFGTSIEFKDGNYCVTCANMKVKKILEEEEFG